MLLVLLCFTILAELTLIRNTKSNRIHRQYIVSTDHSDKIWRGKKFKEKIYIKINSKTKSKKIHSYLIWISEGDTSTPSNHIRELLLDSSKLKDKVTVPLPKLTLGLCFPEAVS